MSTSTTRSRSHSRSADAVRVERGALGALISALRSRGYRVIGPSVRGGDLVHVDIASDSELPAGWRDTQAAGRYRLEHGDDPAVFGHNVGPVSWKQTLFPDATVLVRARRDHGGDGAWTLDGADGGAPPAEPPLALFGVRACDLAAVAIHDRVLAGGAHPDTHYAARRRDAFVVAVDCTRAGGTCFCASAGTGPAATDGFDLALTEMAIDGEHWFLVRAGSARGAGVLGDVPHRPATDAEIAAAHAAVAHAAESMGRTLDMGRARDVLYGALDSPHWDEVVSRCLSCGNCTMVCPTCFCTAIEDRTDLAGDSAERVRVWDTCFALSHSYIHGGSVRATTRARYRQWITHKLATWVDQFGTAGCVGCGRCITWCPVGIDITAEVAALERTTEVPA